MYREDKILKKCREVVRNNKNGIPKTRVKMWTACLSDNTLAIALNYLGYLDKYPGIKMYLSLKNKIHNSDNDAYKFKVELDNISDDVNILSYRDLPKYDVNIDGEIIAIRIYTVNECQPCASLIFTKSDRIDVYWDNLLTRKYFSNGISAYTLIFDERIENLNFNSFIKLKK